MKTGLLFLAWLGFASLTPAATFTVTTTADAGAGSLRQSILDSNVTVGDDTIDFTISGTVTLAAPLPAVTDNTTITGPGTNLLTISGNNAVQIFTFQEETTNFLSDLTVADGLLTNNYSPPPTTNVYLAGAGISNASSLTLQNCVIKDCHNNVQIPTYRVTSRGGGGIYNAGDLLIKNCTVSDCTGNFRSAQIGVGGGINNTGNLRVEDSTVSGCSAYYGGGVYNIANALLTNCIVTSCIAGRQGDGGGVFSEGNLIVLSCTISKCHGFWGGGIETYGNCAITNSTIVDNDAVSVFGGGLALLGETNVMVGCFVSRNTSYHAGITCGNLSMFNCTVSGNYGRAITTRYQTSEIYLNHCTITSNTAPQGQVGGIGVNIRSQNSIFAGNSGSDISGVLTSEGYNLIQNTNGCTITGSTIGDIYNQDPKLGPLADYGGITLTMPLLAGSPAIDAGDPSGGLPTDQRGRIRPYGAARDIGAFESSPPYVIRGTLSGFTLTEPLTIQTSPGNPLTVNRGPYSFDGLSPDAYTVTPLNANFHIVPTNRVVTVGPDEVNADFKAYRWNALTLEGISNRILHLIYAGTNGDNVHTLSSSNLTDWTAISTNTVPSTHIFDIFDTTSQPQRFYRTVKP